MRSTILFILCIVIFTLSSCTREYICQCAVEYTGNQPGLPATDTVEYNIKDTRDEAALKCEANSTEIDNAGVKFKETCVLF